MTAEVSAEKRALMQYNVHSWVVRFAEGKLPNVVAEIRPVFSNVLLPAAGCIPSPGCANEAGRMSELLKNC